jgi:predicted transcriptional regulator
VKSPKKFFKEKIMEEKIILKDNTHKIVQWLISTDIERHSTDTITFNHDIWCARSYGHECNCQPEVFFNGKPLSYPIGLLK